MTIQDNTFSTKQDIRIWNNLGRKAGRNLEITLSVDRALLRLNSVEGTAGISIHVEDLDPILEELMLIHFKGKGELEIAEFLARVMKKYDSIN